MLESIPANLVRCWRAVGCVLGVGIAIPVAPQATTIIGAWAGESRCLGTRATCHDEHVVYHIKAVSQDSAIVDGARVAGRDTVAMGVLACKYDSGPGSIICRIPVGSWRFWVTRDQLEGSLTLADSSQARRVLAHRMAPD